MIETWAENPDNLSPLEFIQREYTWTYGDQSCRVVQSSMRGNVFYGAIEFVDGNERTVEAIVIKTAKRGWNQWRMGLAEIHENYGPHKQGFVKCPIRLIRKLTPTDNETAQEWRNACIEYARNKKADPRFIDGAVVESRFYRYVYLNGRANFVRRFEVQRRGRTVRFLPIYGDTVYRDQPVQIAGYRKAMQLAA